MGLLDFEEEYQKPYTPPKPKRYQPKDNFEELQNDGREEVAEDFSDNNILNK